MPYSRPMRAISLLTLVAGLAGCPGGSGGDAGLDAEVIDDTGGSDGGGSDGGGSDGGGSDGGGSDGGPGDASASDAGPTDAPGDVGSCAPFMPEFYCRSEAECAPSGQTCLAPGESFGFCGTCFMPEMLCLGDGDCTDGSVCVTYAVTCSCGGDASECRPRCSASSGCGEGETCEMSSGRCGPTSCTAGFVCAEYTECMPSAAGADAHGCARKTCTADDECGCGGGCVDGLCYGGLGACTLPPA